MSNQDIRNWLPELEKKGELKCLSGVNCDLEMSGICELLYRESKKSKPAVLFDDIPGFPPGFRTLFGMFATPSRLAHIIHLPEDQLKPLEIVQNWRKKMKNCKPIPPRFVKHSPTFENSVNGNNIDLTIFPSPRFHEMDGGRYIGTAHSVIFKDPEENWINQGVYRCMVIDGNRIAIHILEGQQGSIILNDRYLKQNKAAPVAIAIGIDPTLWFSSALMLPWKTSEYDYAGGLKGEPIDVFEGPYTGLPLPVYAEIIIEGEIHPGDLMDEGPFGEWNGYYSNLGLSPVPEPVIQVKNIMYRDNPILTCVSPSAPPSEQTFMGCFRRAARIWDRLENAGIQNVMGVWCHPEGGGSFFTAVAIKQAYAGHSREVGLLASQAVGNHGRYTVIVDDDIDPSDLSQVMWALSTRADPAQSIQILERQRSTSADTTIPPEEKRKAKVAPKPLVSARAFIDACQPFAWKDEWYPVARIGQQLRSQLLEKWDEFFKDVGFSV